MAKMAYTVSMLISGILFFRGTGVVPVGPVFLAPDVLVHVVEELGLGDIGATSEGE